MVGSSTFIGRDEECQHLLALLRAHRLVTVTGPGGIGKTRLVVETVERGAVVGELASLPPGADVDAVGARVGFATPEAAAAGLGQGPALVVLDNGEHVLAGAGEFASRLLAADGRDDLRVVATSREPLGVPGERVMVLPPLALPVGETAIEESPAVRLFLDRADASGAAWDRSPATLSIVGELCRRLDGLPLAIELAAARARVLSPDELLAHTTRRLDLLRTPGRSGVPARHRSLRAALDVSIDLLDDDERRAFRQLGLFAGPFDLDLATGVLGLADPLLTLDLLDNLVACSLVVAHQRAGASRFELLGLLRDHAREGLDGTGAAEVTERFVDTMVAEADRLVLEGLRRWSLRMIGRVIDRAPDLVIAIDWCLDHDRGPDRAVRLLLPLYPAIHQGAAGLVLAAGRRILDRWPSPAEPVPWHAEAVAVTANAATFMGDDAAPGYGELALAMPGSTPVARLLAHRALGLGARRDDPASAAAHFAIAAQEATSMGARSFAHELAGFQAGATDAAGDGEAARRLIESVVEDAAATGDRINQTWGHLVQATIAIHADRWDDATAAIDRAQEVSEALGYPGWGGALHRLRAVVVAHDPSLGDGDARWRASTEGWRSAVEAAASRASTPEVALTLRAAAVTAHRTGHPAIAAELLAAVPLAIEPTPLLDLFPDELRQLSRLHPTSRPARDIADALRRARSVLATSTEESRRKPDPRAARPAATGTMRRRGDHWEIGLDAHRITVGHRKGLDDLARLVANPDRELHCLELMAGADVGADTGPAVDDRARQAYKARILELQDDVADAESCADLERAARAEHELDALTAQLAEAFGLGGRARSTGSAAERARSAVTHRVRTTVRHIASLDLVLGRHFEAAVRTGTWCAYRPERPVDWTVSTEPGA